MKTIIFFFLLLPLLSLAQFKYSEKNEKPKPLTDSADFYLRKRNQITRQAMDSILHSEEYHALTEKWTYYRNKRNNYTAFTIFMDVAHANYKNLNKSIAENGFPELKNICYRFGFGVTNKDGRIHYDFYLITAGFNNKSQYGNEKIKTSFSNFLQTDVGVDLFRSKYLSIYPYAGLSFRLSNLNYENPATLNPAFTNVSDMVVNNKSINLTSTKVGYQAGLGIDYLLNDPKGNSSASIIVFTKVGTNSAIGKEVYKDEGIRYEPGIKQGDWLVTVGFKFAGRR